MEHYRVMIAQSGKEDIKERKRYILSKLRYRTLAENFTQKIKKAVQSLDTLPTGYELTGFQHRGYVIYYKPYQTYLLFFIVDDSRKEVIVLRVLQDQQNWKYIIREWIKMTEQQ